jgi:ACS family hexuronate transporter-like MFS transporter
MRNNKTFKWVVCALLFLAVTILYVDRQFLSVLAPALSDKFGWSESDYANIVISYQIAYAVGVFGVGWLIDRIGTRFGFAIFMVLWSLVAMAHGWAASVAAFIVVRFALGLTQAGCFPCAIKSAAEWFPKSERAFATGIFNTGSMLGPIIAPLAIIAIYSKTSWMFTAIVLGIPGLIWCVIWLIKYRLPQEPVEDPGEEDVLEKNLSFGEVMRYRATWAFFFGKLFSDPVWWFFLYWLPKFLDKQHNIDIKQMGPPLVTIYAITILGSIGAGWLTRFLVKRGMNVRSSRRLVMLVCALLPVPVILAAFTGNLWLGVILIGIATAGHAGWMANLFSLVSDAFPKSAVASVTGIGTMAGAIGGIFVAKVAGWILDATGSYTVLFVMSGFSYVVAWTLVQLFMPKKPYRVEHIAQRA